MNWATEGHVCVVGAMTTLFFLIHHETYLSHTLIIASLSFVKCLIMFSLDVRLLTVMEEDLNLFIINAISSPLSLSLKHFSGDSKEMGAFFSSVDAEIAICFVLLLLVQTLLFPWCCLPLLICTECGVTYISFCYLATVTFYPVGIVSTVIFCRLARETVEIFTEHGGMELC